MKLKVITAINHLLLDDYYLCIKLFYSDFKVYAIPLSLFKELTKISHLVLNSLTLNFGF